MPSSIKLVVGGFPALADAARQAGRFEQVYSVASTSEFKALVAGELAHVGADSLVLCFADTITVDTPQNLAFIVSWLTSSSYPVLIVGMTPNASTLVAGAPGAGLLNAPVHLNALLGGLAGLGITGVDLSPDPAGFVELSPHGPAAPAPGPGPATVPEAPVPAPAPAFGEPAGPATAPAPAPAPAFGAPAAPAESVPAFGAPAVTPAPAPAPAPAFGAPAVTPAPAESVPAFGAPAESGSAPAPAPAPVFGEPAVTPAPADPVPAFGGPAAPGPAPQGSPGPAFAAPAGPGGNGFAVRSSEQHLLTPPGGALATPPDLAGPGGGIAGRVGAAVTREPYGSGARGAARGRVIAVCAAKGGVGKSTLAVNLASYAGLRLRGSGRRVVCLDANALGNADIGKYLNEWEPTVYDIAQEQFRTADAVARHTIDRADLNTSFVLGPSDPLQASPAFINPALYNQVTDALRENYDYIVLDTPVAEARHPMFVDFVLQKADYLIVAVAPSFQTTMNIRLWLDNVCQPVAAGGGGWEPSHVGIVLNRFEEGLDFGEDEVRRGLSAYPFLASIPETAAWKRAANHFEIVAARNYSDLSNIFSQILYVATGGDPALEPGPAGPPPANPKGSLGGLLTKLKSRRRRG